MAVPETSPSPWAACVSLIEEESAVHLNGQVDGGPRGHVAVVHVAAVGARRDCHQHGIGGGRDAEHAGKGRQGERDVVVEADLGCAGLHGEAADPRLRELVGEEAEAGQDRRPAPSGHLDFVDGYREDVTRGGALNLVSCHT